MADADIKDFLTALSAAGVRFVVVGAYAVASHGRVRGTTDFDVLVEPTLANAARLEHAVREFAGASLAYFGISVEELARPKFGFFMGVEPDRIDVLTRIAGVSFARAWRGRTSARIVGVEVSVLGLDELIAAKRALARERPPGSVKALQDAADLSWLTEARTRRSKRL